MKEWFIGHRFLKQANNRSFRSNTIAC